MAFRRRMMQADALHTRVCKLYTLRRPGAAAHLGSSSGCCCTYTDAILSSAATL